MSFNMPVIDPVLLKLLQARYMKNLAEELCKVQPISTESISDPATGENIFTWTYAKQMFENNAMARWEDDGGAI